MRADFRNRISVRQAQADGYQQAVNQVSDLPGLQNQDLGSSEVQAARALYDPQMALELRRGSASYGEEAGTVSADSAPVTFGDVGRNGLGRADHLIPA